MRIFDKARAALGSLAKAVAPKGLDKTQAEARSMQGSTLNYMSVNTLDPTRLASAFTMADQGFITEQARLFDLIEEQDAHIFSELGKRRRAVTGLGWDLLPPKDADQSELDRTGELKDMLCAIPRFEDAQYDLTDAIGKGLAALEIQWRLGEEWSPQALNFEPQRHFQTDRDTGELQYLSIGVPEPLRPHGWIVHEHRAKSGYIEQAALFRVLAWTYAYKAYNVRDMQKFLEKYGLPLVLGKYPSGIGEKQRSALLRAVRNIGNDGAGVVPSTMSLEFIQAMKSGSIDDFLNATAYWEKKQSMTILGGTLTSQADGKSSTNALGQVHNEVRREIMLHDVRQIEPTWNDQLVRPIALFNGMFPPDRLPRLRYNTSETPDQEKMVKVLSLGAAMGMEISVDYAHEVTQIPRAGKDKKSGQDQKILTVSKAGLPSPSSDAGAALSRLVALSRERGLGDVEDYPERLAALCVPHEEALIQQVGAIIAEADGFDEALSGIEALAMRTGLPDAWAEDMALGMSAAQLAGRADIGTD